MKFTIWKLIPPLLFCYFLFALYAYSSTSTRAFKAEKDKQSELAYLKSTISDLEESISNLELEKEELENNLQECTQENSSSFNTQSYQNSYTYDYEKDDLESNNRKLKHENSRLESEIDDLENRIDDLESR